MKKKISNALNSSKNIFLKVVKLINKNKKKVVMGLSVFLVVFISVCSFINLRYPTKINAYIAHVVNKGEPVNSYFDDENFYKAVVDAYNKENKTNLPYTTNLTDEQLKSIKNILYRSDSEKIRSTKGIEKLINLESLELGLKSYEITQGGSNLIEKIDLSNNLKLRKLELDSGNLSSIDLSKNIALKELNLAANNISSIDLSNNTALTELDLFYNKISNIDLSKNTALTSLELAGNNLSKIDLSKNAALTYLNLGWNNISNIDLSKNTELIGLGLDKNNLSKIDLSKNTALTGLILSDNEISNIDLSKNTELTKLDLEHNSLSSIKLYDNFNISELKNAIKNQKTYQTNLDFGSNRIIKLTKDYKYYYSDKIVIPSEVDIQTFIDNLGLQNLTSKVFNNDEEVSSGKVKENYILKLYYEDKKIDSVPIIIFENSAFDDKVFYKAVVDAYNSENKTSLPYTTNLTDEQLKSIKSVSYNGNKKSDSEKIKSTKGIEKLTSLKDLNLSNNNISNIDLSQNTSLTELWLCDNEISNIDLSKNTSLIVFVLSSNKISNIDLSKNTKLIGLGLDKNNISNIDLSKNTELIELGLYDNNISKIDLSKNTALTYLELDENNLSKIDLSKNTSLTYLSLYSNKLSSIDLSKNTSLTELNLAANNISYIDLSKNTKLTTLYLYDNSLKLNAYVKENGTLTSSSIKMPEGSNKIYLTYEIEDNSIANFADNRLNGLKAGKTNATVTLNGVKASSSSTENMKVDGTITVFDRLKGDINNDDKITIADVSLLYRHVRKTKVIEDSKTLEVSDLTGDDKITIADVAKLYRYVRGKINEL